MYNENNFTNEMFGYNKEEVEEYIQENKSEYASYLQAERLDSDRLPHELTIVTKKIQSTST